MKTNVIAYVRRGTDVVSGEGLRVCFSPLAAFRFDGGQEDRALAAVLASHLAAQPGLAVYAGDRLFHYLMQLAGPSFLGVLKAVVADDPAAAADAGPGVPVVAPDRLPDTVETVFLAHTLQFPRWRMRARLPARVTVVEPTVLPALAPELIPVRAWSPLGPNIYPIEIPEINVETGLDLLLLDCPARNLAMLPNGLAYVHNALKQADVRFQTFDLDIVTYHRYHIHRLYDCGGTIVLADGTVMPTDPWQAEHYDLWAKPEVINYFLPVIEEMADAIIKARPKALGLSVQQCNEHFARRLVNLVKSVLPELAIVVGGFSCYNADIGRRSFPEADFMCIGEADFTVGPLIEAFARGERPRNMPGVIGRDDDPAIPFMPAPMPHNLDALDFPRYEWFGIDIYQNFNGYRLTPVIASRGCRWARCTFCAERFYWRIRTAENFVDELEWLVEQGCQLFMFNESDLNGQPERLVEICDEIIRRGLKVKLTGQLRINKLSSRAYFDKLREAGFVSLRFGIDAFSENTLRLQKKGYTKEMVAQNLTDCWEAGIWTEVNWVIGVPGETDADVDEGIAFILENRPYIGRLANVNPLILVNGGVYWIEPDVHGICFRAPREELYETFNRAIPAHLWYSENPYIDANVRKAWFERIVTRLYEAGFPIGEWAARIIEDVRTSRDINRAAAPAPDRGTVAFKRPKAVLVKSLPTHNIFAFAGFHYAVPVQHADPLDFLSSDKLPAGVLKDFSLDNLIATIEDAQGWADLRGQYDPRRLQRLKGSFMRADATLDRTETPEAAADLKGGERVLPFGNLYVLLDAGFPGEAAPGETVVAAFDKAFGVTFMKKYGRYKILSCDGRFFGVPLSVSWTTMEMMAAPAEHGILCADDFRVLCRMIEAADPAAGRAAEPKGQARGGRGSGPASEAYATPQALGRLGGYWIIGYEGFVYGVPESLGEVDLTETDLTELPGLIRDVSRNVVELEILQRARVAGRLRAAG